MMPRAQQGSSEPMLVALTREEFDLVLDALDSHVYWQLSDELYRRDGNVLEPGSDEEENVEEIRRVRLLLDRLQSLRSPQP